MRPVLAAACFECHGGGKKLRGGLTLTSRDGLLRGGDTGPTLVPGDAGSLLLKVISYKDDIKMPPRGKLTDEQIANLTTWVKSGAPWPGSVATAPTAERIRSASAAQGALGLAAARRHLPPAVKEGAWPRNPIDRFLLVRLEAAGLRPPRRPTGVP